MVGTQDDRAEPARVTELLRELREGAPGAGESLFRVVYGELHRLAAAQMRRERPGHTLQPTALVHEAYLRLMGSPDAPWRDRSHFLCAASRAMRAILVDFARRRGALKRGGGRRRITFDEGLGTEPRTPDDVLSVHEALVKLEAVDPQGSRVVELRFFGGLTVAETARVMEVAESTVYLAWEHARAWLYREIGG
jgi:RNA polymerase sigma factor (TIGR02999 family)